MKVLQNAKKVLTGEDKKKSKGKDFLNGLKEWITSPGGIATLLLFIGVCWYIHKQTSGKGAKA